MCGITGFLWYPGQAAGQDAQPRLQSMMEAIAHRGPDSNDHWLDEAAGVALGHLRLAIVDLSPAGAQPMGSVSGRYMLTYNGEIYNHQKLRAEIEATGKAPAWRGTSDTEVLIAGIELWGLEATLAKLQGMFAIALWDKQDKTLTLARDRLGEKPLYYGWNGTGKEAVFLFGSELKAFHAHPSFKPVIRRDAVIAMLRHGHVPEDLVAFARRGGSGNDVRRAAWRVSVWWHRQLSHRGSDAAFVGHAGAYILHRVSRGAL